MSEVVMPRLSDSMEEGTIVKWLKADGDDVVRNEDLVEIETDKATVVYSAEDAGILRIVAAEDAVVAVGEVIAQLGSEAVPGEEPSTKTEEPAMAAVAAAAPARDSSGGKVSPVARRLAVQLGVDLAGVRGSGPHGRIVKSDVEAAQAPAAVAAEAPAPAAGSVNGTPARPLTRTQKLIAKRMVEATSTVPTFNASTDVDMGAAVVLRAELKQTRADEGAVPTYNDMVVKAAAIALREFPRVNGSYRDDGFVLHERANVGIAVAAEEALLVPTIFDADRLSLTAIAATSSELASRVRSATVTPAELDGGTFTVSNLGMLGVTEFTAVINVPQAAILAVGRLDHRPAVRDGELVARPMLNMTLTCDHRILYGADGAGFLARVRELLERPVALLA